MAKVYRGRPAEAAAAPAEKALFHDTVEVSSTEPTPLTNQRCASIAIKPDAFNTSEIYIGYSVSIGDEELTVDNGFPLGPGIVLGANQSSSKVKVYAICASEGNKVRIIGVL